MNTATNALPRVNISCLRNGTKIKPTTLVNGPGYVMWMESAMRGPLPASIQKSVETAQRLAASLFGTPVRIEAVHYSSFLAHYDPLDDVIRISAKWEKLTELEQVLALFHEMRHRAVIRYKVKPHEDFSAFKFLVSEEREAKIRALVEDYYEASSWAVELDAYMLSEAAASVFKMNPGHLLEILKKLLFSHPGEPLFDREAAQAGSPGWWNYFNPDLKELTVPGSLSF